MPTLAQLPVYIAAKDWASAETALRDAAKSESCMAPIFYNLAKVLEASGKYNESGCWFEKATEKDTNYAMAWFELGRWQLAHDKLAASYNSFERANKLNPDDEDAQRNFARLALRLGKWEQASKAWERFDDHEAKQALYRIGVETGADCKDELSALLANKSERVAVLSTMTRTAKGRIPLKLD